MRITVVGAGVIGVTTAYFLARDGHEVEVLERQPGVALETSFANGGQISTSHAEPWASFDNLLNAVRWLGWEEAPLLVRPRLDVQQWRWFTRFLLECLPARVDHNTAVLVALALLSRNTLRGLRKDLRLEYDASECGILHIYSNPKSYAQALRHAETMRSLGCAREPVNREQCLAIEPALSAQADRLVGGTFTREDEVGDAHLFTQVLARRAEDMGVRFRFGVSVERLLQHQGKITAIKVSDTNGCREEAVDQLVLAAGCYSSGLAAGIGLYLPVYPAKGYSITIPVHEGMVFPRVSLIDEQYRVVTSHLGQRLRVAGTAEFTGYDLSLTPARLQALERRVCTWFPDLHTASGEIEHWTGLRPATPSNIPLLGRSKLPNLWLNTGHGTLGWTMAAGSGRLLAGLMAGRISNWQQAVAGLY